MSNGLCSEIYSAYLLADRIRLVRRDQVLSNIEKIRELAG